MKSYSLYQPPPRFRWPDDSKCCVMLCFDVDGETTALSEDPTLKNRLTTYSETTYGPSIGVPRLLGLLKYLNVPATFFVPGYIAEQHPRMMEAIVAGQQIATYFRKNPDARHEIDFDREEVAGNNVRLSLSSHERWST